MTVIKETDWELVGALLDKLKQLNAAKDGELWQSAGTECGETLVTSAKKLLQEIVKRVGSERVVGVVDYGCDGISDYQIHKDDFDNFVGTLDNLIEQKLSKVNYENAWTLLKGLAHLLDTSDQFTATIRNGYEITVHLNDALRVYLYRIIIEADLEDFVSNILCNHDKMYTWAGRMCKKTSIGTLCGDLKLMEDIIRSMCQSKTKSFVFDLEELDENKRNMTLAEFVEYECIQQLE